MTHGEITATLLALGALLGAARILGESARRIGQPAVVGEILAGILLGPTVAGTFAPEFFSFINPTPNAALFLNGFALVAVVLFTLVAGLEVELASVWRQGRAALGVSLGGIAAPFAIGVVFAGTLPEFLGRPDGVAPLLYTLFFATALSISALPVIAKTLMDLNIYRTDIGMTVIASAMFDDLFGWSVFALLLGMMGISGGRFTAGETVGLTLLFAALALTVGRWAINASLPWLNRHTTWPGGVIGFAVSLALIAAAFTEWIGIHAVFGSFIAGIALGDSPHLRQKTKQTIEHFVSFIFAPLFFASIGLKVNFAVNFDLALTAVVLVIACVGKILGCAYGARRAGVKSNEAWAIGFGMNARGAMEIVLATLALQYGVIGQPMFVALVIMALVTSVISGPAMRRLLDMSKARTLLDYFSEALFVPALAGRTPEEVIGELSALAAEETGLDGEVIRTGALARERIVPTGLDNGVAIPHARLAGLRAPVICVGISEGGIDFNARDGQDAQLVFLILTPQGDDKAQITILAGLSRLLSKAPVREALKRIDSFHALRTVVEQNAPAPDRGR
ncbi:MAG: cation:proton antiporter [Nitrospinae bacterium]|nr:cation:proton antiporter [Nitrospinota bacterium]